MSGERNGFATGGRGGGSGKNDAYFTDDHFSPRDVVPIFPCAARLAAPVYKLILRYNECVRSIMVEEVRNQIIPLPFNTQILSPFQQILSLSFNRYSPSLSTDTPSLPTDRLPVIHTQSHFMYQTNTTHVRYTHARCMTDEYTLSVV